MDVNKLVARAKALILSPKTEWPVIAGEPATIGDLYKNYVLVLAAIPVIATFIKSSIIGSHIMFIGRVRTDIGAGLTAMVVSYALSLAMLYVLALIIDALAPTFSGQKDRTQAFKAAAYSMTASWIAGAAVILPGVGTLIALLGGLYGIYLLYVGLPHTMKSPPEKAVGYTAVTIIIAIVLSAIVFGIVGSVSTVFTRGPSIQLSGSDVRIDKDSPLGQLEQWGKTVEEAGKKLEAAQASGDQQAQAAAFGEMLGAALGGGGGQVEALPTERLKAFVPEKLDGLPRANVSVDRGGALGMQITTARAVYRDAAGDRTLELEIVDAAAAKGFLALAGFAGLEGENEQGDVVEKVYRDDGRLVREQWDSSASEGEYGVVLGDRFTVKVSGEAHSLKDLRKAAHSIDLRGLERLKDAGAKK